MKIPLSLAKPLSSQYNASQQHESLPFLLTCPLVTVCVLLLDLVIALAKFHLVLVFSVEARPIQALFSFTAALSESFLPMLTHEIFSLLSPTYLHFSQVRKPVLDSMI